MRGREPLRWVTPCPGWKSIPLGWRTRVTSPAVWARNLQAGHRLCLCPTPSLYFSIHSSATSPQAMSGVCVARETQ